MASSVLHNQLAAVQQQLSLARTEIFNLRKEMKNLKYQHSKDINKVRECLETWRCPSCSAVVSATSSGPVTEAEQPDTTVELKPIGVIKTDFVMKRAVPRQPSLNLNCHGRISLFNCVFTNPEHSLEGLEGFSHMWIIFHFHKNMSSHIQAKVSPPRLNGARVGVFGTRSPHRPCPIGLSLVQIDNIQGADIYFRGVDMVDGTPVLDLKPYIPHYDSPVDYSLTLTDTCRMERLELDGQESDGECDSGVTTSVRPPLRQEARLCEREAPDGQDASPRAPPPPPSPPGQIRVPEWISQAPLRVTFTPQAESFLSTVRSEDNVRAVITDILREDPRSVYLRHRYGNQFYTFLINNYHISCKFDDSNCSVKVFRVVPADSEWQCSDHGLPTLTTEQTP